MQFASDADAQFFMAAYDAVPALLSEIEDLERRAADPGELDRARAKTIEQDRELAQAREALAKMEQQVSEIVVALAASEARTRGANALARRVNRALEATRATLFAERKARG